MSRPPPVSHMYVTPTCFTCVSRRLSRLFRALSKCLRSRRLQFQEGVVAKACRGGLSRRFVADAASKPNHTFGFWIGGVGFRGLGQTWANPGPSRGRGGGVGFSFGVQANLEIGDWGCISSLAVQMGGVLGLGVWGCIQGLAQPPFSGCGWGGWVSGCRWKGLGSGVWGILGLFQANRGLGLYFKQTRSRWGGWV